MEGARFDLVFGDRFWQFCNFPIWGRHVFGREWFKNGHPPKLRYLVMLMARSYWPGLRSIRIRWMTHLLS